MHALSKKFSHLLAYALALIILAGTWSAGAEKAVPSGLSTKEFSRQASVLLWKAAGQQAQGLALVLFSDTGILASQGFGLADPAGQNPVLPDQTGFEYGSVNKVLVWLSLMQLAETGKLSLTDDISRHLPEGFYQALHLNWPITLFDLMNHQAGFEEYPLDELLDYARTVRQTPASALSPVRVNAFLRGVVAEHYTGFEEKGMALSCDLAADATLMLDEPRFRRAFENILLNALKHCPAGSQVQVKTEKARRRFKKTLRILIADSGPAISPAQQMQIFQPFVKLDESRNQKDGYGLGLSIAQAITAQAGGTLKVEPMPPPYTKAFVMELPLVYNKSNTSKGTRDAAMA